MSAHDDQPTYLHGYSPDEQERLRRQARFLEPAVFRDIDYPGAQRLIEVGSGVGAQTEVLLRRFPGLHITCVDLNPSQLEAAQRNLGATPEWQGRYALQQADATALPFADHRFDSAFLCWVLEHVPSPAAVLADTRRVLAPGARIHITEVMNASLFIAPDAPNTMAYWSALNDFQRDQHGDPFVGARLGNLLQAAGYRDIVVQARTFHLDNRTPAERGAIFAYWEDLLLSAADQLRADDRVTTDTIEGMRSELHGLRHDPDAVFFYSFIQAHATA